MEYSTAVAQVECACAEAEAAMRRATCDLSENITQLLREMHTDDSESVACTLDCLAEAYGAHAALCVALGMVVRGGGVAADDDEDEDE